MADRGVHDVCICMVLRPADRNGRRNGTVSGQHGQRRLHGGTLDYEKEENGQALEENDLAEPTLQVRMLEREDSAAAVSDSTQLSISGADYQVLLKIVEAEAGSEDLNGRILVANVVLNRVKSELFPDCVTDVVYQHSNGVYQFSPVKNGTIDTVSISEETKQAVELALDGMDLSKGALYFAARNAANEKNMRWFDTHLVRLFAHGGHEFFG